MSNVDKELEMPPRLTGIVDQCFEEGQYESGMAVLDRLRSPMYKPAPSQIRQVLYLALHPGPLPVENKSNATPASPSKIPVARSDNCPTSSDIEAARQLLMSFVNTNSPESLFRALPSHASVAPDWRDLDDGDSLLAKESLCIRDCRSFWAMLMGGLIRVKQDVSLSPKAKGKRRQKDAVREAATYAEDKSAFPPSVISESAWPVLGWLLALFERDELLAVGRGLPRHSPLLLHQFMSAQGGSYSRSDSDAPLDILIQCLEQPDERRRGLGLRLLCLLVNLTGMASFDVASFVASFSGRLPLLSLEQLIELLASIPISRTGQAFKLAICRRFLTDKAIDVRTGEKHSRPAPVARALPRAAPIARGRPASETPGEIAPSSVERKHPLPTPMEVIELLEKYTIGPEAPKDLVDKVYRMKFDCLLTYGNLQRRRPDGQIDPAWSVIMTEGRLSQTLEVAFGSGDDGRVYRETLGKIVLLWRSAL